MGIQALQLLKITVKTFEYQGKLYVIRPGDTLKGIQDLLETDRCASKTLSFKDLGWKEKIFSRLFFNVYSSKLFTFLL